MAARVLVNGRTIRFGECLLDALGGSASSHCDERRISFRETRCPDGTLAVSLELDSSRDALPLGHNALPLGQAPECPTRTLAADPSWPRRFPDMSVAVVALVRYNTGSQFNVLFTRRPEHM